MNIQVDITRTGSSLCHVLRYDDEWPTKSTVTIDGVAEMGEAGRVKLPVESLPDLIAILSEIYAKHWRQARPEIVRY